MIRFLCASTLLLALAGGCGLPRDAEGTLERVRGGTLRVGVLNAPPWALAHPRAPTGVEPELVSRLAARLGSRVVWVTGNEGEVMRAAERGEVDLVVGGLAATSPWAPHLGATRPFYEDTLVLALPVSMPFRRGMPVAVQFHAASAGAVRGAGGLPVPVDDPSAAADAAALHAWSLRADRRVERILERSQRVWMVPAGENGWLGEVERFLDEQRSAVPLLLRATR